MDTIITTSQLTKHYGKQCALDNFDLTIQKGEIVALAGRNGAGKTTLLRLLTGLSQIESGNISLFGSVDNVGLEENRRFVGSIIEAPAFIPEFTAKQNLTYYAIQREISDLKRIDELLTLVELADTGKKKFKDFSLGMKQRLAIALALLHNPKLLIIDEPTNGLDPEGIIQVRHLLQKLTKETQLTIFVCSHILPELEQLATRFVFIEQGRKVAEMTKEELRQQTRGYYELIADPVDKARDILTNTYTNSVFTIKDNQTIEILDTTLESSEIIRLLVENNIAVKQFAHHHQTLEELFLELIKGGEAAW